MLSQLEQACKTYSTKSSSGLIEFDSNWQRIYVTALILRLDQAIPIIKKEIFLKSYFPKTIRDWKKLSNDIKQSLTLTEFKIKIKKIY